MRLEKAEVELRIGISSFADYVYGSPQHFGLPVKRLYKATQHDGFTVSIPLPTKVVDGEKIEVDDVNLTKARQLIAGTFSTILVKMTVLIVAHFLEDESEFSISPKLALFCGEHDANMWIFTYPNGDWSDDALPPEGQPEP